MSLFFRELDIRLPLPGDVLGLGFEDVFRSRTCGAAATERGEAAATEGQRAMNWAQRVKRMLAIDIETCRQCGGGLRVIDHISNMVGC